MRDSFGRKINYLRISVTDRCNLRCRYCMPENGVPLFSPKTILSFEEIIEVITIAVPLGMTKVRLTGGEPLIRRDIEKLIALISKVPGIKDFSLTTNGILLSRYAQVLADAGLQRVNVSLDTVRPERFRMITRGGELQLVFRGLQAAQKAGLYPIKLNCVVAKSANEPDAIEVAKFARTNGFEIRFIRIMDAGTGTFSVVDGGTGGDCPRCNRIRLSADGIVKPCLFSDLGFDVRRLGVANALHKAIENKPESGGPCKHNWIRAVGG